jgi:hypothetical protein
MAGMTMQPSRRVRLIFFSVSIFLSPYQSVALQTGWICVAFVRDNVVSAARYYCVRICAVTLRAGRKLPTYKEKAKVAGPVEGTQPYHRGRNRNWHDQYGVRHSLRRSDGCSDYFRERHRRSLIVYIFCVNACLRGEGDTADLHGRRVATSRRRP